MIDAKIFRDNDIRGVYPTDLNEEIVAKIGLGLVKQFSLKKVAVGMDMRVSGPSLKGVLIETLINAGIDVVDLGMITTPMSFFASWKLDVDLSIIISASHNPKEYNGMIISAKGGLPVGKEKLKELAGVVNSESMLKRVQHDKRGELERKDITSQWLEHAFKIVGPEKIRPINVVLDNGNSVTSVTLEPALKKLPQVKATKLFFEPDGAFPNHMPNPLLMETLETLKKTVVKEKAELGLAYDGDGDRVLIVDEKGQFVTGSALSAFLCKYLLQHHKYTKKPKLMYTTVMSRIVPETIEKYGGIAVRSHVGHAYIKAKMKEENAIFAGEHSGHFYFRDNHNADSALLGTLLILAAVSADPRPVSQQMKEFSTYASNDEISVKVEDRDEFIKNAESLLMKERVKPKKTVGDGITFDYPDYWFNLRPSGTEPVVRLNIEAYRADRLESVVKKILKIVKEAGGKI